MSAIAAIPVLGGFLIGYSTITDIKGWYKDLNKPPWNPPNKAFGPVWTMLYLGMGYASHLVIQTSPTLTDALGTTAMIWYGAQLALNFLWTPLFFKLHWTGLALAEMLLLIGAASVTALEFYQVNQVAGLLFVPYLAWLGVACSLNAYIWLYNPSSKAKKD